MASAPSVTPARGGSAPFAVAMTSSGRRGRGGWASHLVIRPLKHYSYKMNEVVGPCTGTQTKRQKQGE